MAAGDGTWDFEADMVVFKHPSAAVGGTYASIGPYVFSLTASATVPAENTWTWDTNNGPSTSESGTYRVVGNLLGAPAPGAPFWTNASSDDDYDDVVIP